MADFPSTQLFCCNLWMQMVGHEQFAMLHRHTGTVWCIYMETAAPARRKIVKKLWIKPEHRYFSSVIWLPDRLPSTLFMRQCMIWYNRFLLIVMRLGAIYGLHIFNTFTASLSLRMWQMVHLSCLRPNCRSWWDWWCFVVTQVIRWFVISGVRSLNLVRDSVLKSWCSRWEILRM